MRSVPYVGEQDRPQVNVAEHLVMNLMESCCKAGQNVTTDNYFTSLKAAKNLLQHNNTMVGTLRRIKKKSCMIYCWHISADTAYITTSLYAEGWYQNPLLEGQAE